MRMFYYLHVVILYLLFSVTELSAADLNSDLLSDLNSDGEIVLLAFGDSITWGMGDATFEGEYVPMAPLTDGTLGYPSRISNWSEIMGVNAGIPGEFLTESGINRVPSALLASNADLVLLFEGSNDASFLANPFQFRSFYQKAVNTIKALGKIPIVATILPPCCDRKQRAPYTRSFSAVVREISQVNNLALVDLEKGWDMLCPDENSCDLYCQPEGLHPNSKGYDLLAQMMLATVYGIDLFESKGAAQLESRLGLESGSTLIRVE